MPLLDTNVILRGQKKGVITYPVLEELDRLKKAEGLLGKQARDAIFFLYEHQDLIDLKSFNERLNGETVDDYLIRKALQEDEELLTLDLSLYLKAKAAGVRATFYKELKEGYHPVSYIEDEEYAEIMEGKWFKKLPENHFLIYENVALKIHNGFPVEVPFRNLENEWCGKIKPRNIEQRCLIDLLLSKVPVVAATGNYGTGKSFILLNYMLQELEAGRVKKIIVVPNNSQVENTRELAALPGGVFQKEFLHLGPMIDLLGAFNLEQKVTEEEIEILPMAVIRGRNLQDSFIWVS